MKKPAPAAYPINPLIGNRWSPRAFADTPVTGDDLRSLFEAARWAASCFNEQPWHFIVARREDEADFARMLSCLADANRAWVVDAPVLIISVARLHFARNDKPNRHALHDLGQSVAQLSIQASSMGIAIHQMAGFSPDKARELYAIPESHDAVTAIAVGYYGEPEQLPAELAERERSERTRRAQETFVFTGAWGEPLGE